MTIVVLFFGSGALSAGEFSSAFPTAEPQWDSQRGWVVAGLEPGGSSPAPASLPVESPAAPAAVAPSELILELLPCGLLWRPPLANPREPRCWVKFFSLNDQEMIDTAIGAAFGLARAGPAEFPQEGVQLDATAVVFTRFGILRRLTASDYRLGLPITFAARGWQMKLGYEHSGSHLGDEYMLLPWETGIPIVRETAIRADRDEVVAGIARTFGDQLRVYGQTGYAFSQGEAFAGLGRARFDCGAEYTFPRWGSVWGAPFAAVDLDLQSVQDFSPNLTVQLGWQWKTAQKRRSSARLAAEYYTGYSPYGQFYDIKESWWAFTAAYEW